MSKDSKTRRPSAEPRCAYCGHAMMVVHRGDDGSLLRQWCANDECPGNVGNPRDKAARPPAVVLESILNTLHGPGHPRADKRVRTYIGLVLDRVEDGIEIYRMAKPGKWREEDPAAADADTQPQPPARARRRNRDG